MRRREMAQAIATSLFEAETAVDAALEKSALLIAQVASLRREHGVSAVLGHQAVCAVTRSIEALGQARQHAIQAHEAFAASAPYLGVRPATLHGGGAGKPEDDTIPVGRSPLRVAEAA